MTARSHNHRLFQIGRDLWRTPGPSPLLKQGHLELLVQDHVQTAFEYLQGWRFHNFPGQLVPALSHPHRKKAFPDVQREPPVFSLCPLSVVLSLGTTEESLAPSSLHPPFRYLYTLIRSP